jgi:hypothetical protein
VTIKRAVKPEEFLAYNPQIIVATAQEDVVVGLLSLVASLGKGYFRLFQITPLHQHESQIIETSAHNLSLTAKTRKPHRLSMMFLRLLKTAKLGENHT